MRTHIALSVSDLEASRAFYRRLLGVDAHRAQPGYVQFLNADLNLALSAHGGARAAQGHFGLEVDSAAAVEERLDRVRAAGLEATVERDVTCCYARQTKFWLSDPDGNRWETFYVAERQMLAVGSQDETCCQPA